MKPENQVCNLELSKRLKELGVKQKSYFFWTGWHSRPSLYTSSTFRSSQLDGSFSAFTVAELGDMLPPDTPSAKTDCTDEELAYWCGMSSEEGNTYWDKFNERIGDGLSYQNIWGKSEADARAKMLIYLLENKLIESPASEEAK